MKLVLASQGFTTPEIAAAVSELLGKPLADTNVVIINEAYVGIGAGRDERWLINELSLVERYVKGAISFVNLRAYEIAEIEQRIAFADLVYVVGGAQAILPKLFKETGFDKVLTEVASHKVIMGTSAGANVLGRQIEDPAYWQDQYGQSEKYLTEPTLGLVNFNILPHFERDDHPLRVRERLEPLLATSPFPLYGVTDEQAVVYDEGKVKFVGGDVKMFGKDTQ